MHSTLLPPPPSPARHPLPAPPAAPPSQIAANNPLHLLWIWGLPQLLLLAMNLRSFGLIWGDMVESQRWTARTLVVGEILLLLAAFGASFVLRRLKQTLDFRSAAGLLALPVAYLWYATAVHVDLIPRAVSQWIVRPEDFLYYQYMLAGPAVMHALLLVAPERIGRAAAAGGLAFVGFPVLFTFGWGALFRNFGPAAEHVLAVPFVLLTLVFLSALMRWVVASYQWTRQRTVQGLLAMTVLVALAMPVAGLALNASIPFPVNFQSRGIYALAVLNGVLLCLPNFRSVALHRAVTLAQAATFPFTLYFFLVFLPYLVLSLPAMLAFGSGFLILTPTVLFLLHGGRLLDAVQNERRDGSAWRPMLALAGAALLIPAGLTADALLERRVLNRALDFAYDANRAEHAPFEGNRTLLRWGLQRLHDRQNGLVLPFITDFYSAVVFNGLFLSPEKQAFLQKFYFGEVFPTPKADLFSRGQPGFTPRVSRPQTAEVRLANLETATVPGASEQSRITRVTVTMHNDANAEGEFVAPLRVPEGVLVAGFGLKIGDEMVPGRIVEKSTALWVYQKIRDVVRRDPGLLIYTGPDSLELRVYPLAAKETRTVQIEFLSSKGAAAQLRVGQREVRIGEAGESEQVVAAELDEKTTALVLPEKAMESLPAVRRQPYLHFIIDRSRSASPWTPRQMKDRLAEVAGHFPEAPECAIETANFETSSVADRMPVSGIGGLAESRLTALPARGGFALDRAIKGIILRHDAARKTAGEAWAREYPLIVVLRGATDEPVNEGGLSKLAELLPDVDGYWESTRQGKLESRGWEGALKPSALAAAPVTLLKCGGEFAVAARGATRVVSFAKGEISVLAADAKSWQALPAVRHLPPTEQYSRGLAVWQESKAMALQGSESPAAMRELMARSRTSRIMVPESSFIVVESSAQWKMLDEKERQKLSANQALGFDDVPEPGAVTMLLAGGIWLCGRRWRRSAAAPNF